ncbi:hypothetical protein ES332_A02G054200v1 [Gossypium tomentosum]|uniref:Uncharacterized protein n=1 Tax=Gossypium tomentosum TaxID=34277 RepID=A0A5D2RFZ6_GOSTO|nr:hypothetical protein ES332_A02G054200v1 [Gossypium tomentosum]
MKSHLPSSIIPLFHRILLPFPIPMQYPFPFPIPPCPPPISHFPFPSPLFHRFPSSTVPSSHSHSHFPFPFPLSTIPTAAAATTETATRVLLSSKNIYCPSYTQLMLLSPVSLRLSSAVEFPHCAGSLGIQRLSQSTPVQSS